MSTGVDCSCNGGIIYGLVQCKGCSNSNCGYCDKTGSYVVA